MKRQLLLASLLTVAALPFSQAAHAQHANTMRWLATHAQANACRKSWCIRVIVRESRYRLR